MEKTYKELIEAVIKAQESIIGPIAWSRASEIENISINGREILVSGDGKKVLQSLVFDYEKLFGKASVEACKNAIYPIIKDLKVDLPDILK